ncbi:hypothetical protein [uncultured Campylobacter sp.]|nr:hypothetical protein [uncultured Campylobacter sp.]
MSECGLNFNKYEWARAQAGIQVKSNESGESRLNLKVRARIKFKLHANKI